MDNAINTRSRAPLAAGLSLLLLLLSGVAASQQATVDEVTEEIAQARATHAQAQALGHGWSVTSRYIEQAETALAEGRSEEAMAAAQRATLTATQSVAQAKAEQADWSNRVPKS